jgi:hypothetical protein
MVGGMGQVPQKGDESDVFVITSISMMKDDEYFLELVQEKRLRKKSRKEIWEQRDNLYGDADDFSSPFFLGRFIPPLVLPLCANEFMKLNPRVGQVVKLQLTPVGPLAGP